MAVCATNTMFRLHNPLAPAFADTVHAMQGTNQLNVIGMYMDGTQRTAWLRDMLYTALSRVQHLSQVNLLSFDEPALLTLLTQPLPDLLSIDEWVYNNNCLSQTHPQTFSSWKPLFKPLKRKDCPKKSVWVAYAIANHRGMTYIGSSFDQRTRLRDENNPNCQRQPKIMTKLASGWSLYAWVGPLPNKEQAEVFEYQWKQQGNHSSVRNMASHLLSI